MGSLAFSDRGLAGFDFRELKRELSFDQTVSILRLFGRESTAHTIYPTEESRRAPQPPPLSKADADSRFNRLLTKFKIAYRESRTASETERPKLVADAYRRLFPGPDEAASQGLTAYELRLQLSAASSVANQQPDDRNIDEVLRLFHALERSGSATEDEAETAQNTLIHGRRFQEAAAMARSFPARLEILPAVKPLEQPVPRSLWKLSDDRILVQRAAPELSGARLIVLGDPRCQFTVNLAEAAAGDTELRALLGGAMWIIPPGPRMNVDDVLAWEQRHQWAPLQYVNREAEWPEIESWGTPTFVFMKDGQVQETVVAWPPEGRKAELMAAAARLGLSPPP